MTLTIDSLDDVDQALVDQMHVEASAMLREKHPEIELARGPFGDLVLYFMSTLNAVERTNIQRLRQSMSLKAINENPELADAGTVDDVLSNAGITRLTGDKATGEVTIVVAADNTVVIPAGLSFLGNGLEFVATTAYVGRPTSATAIADTDRVLTPLNDGTFAFTIPITAVEEGAAGNIRRGTKLVPGTRPENFVRAAAAVDFTGGTATETNEELLTKMQEGQAAKSMGGLVSWTGLIKQQPQFARVLDVNIRGMGDPEQLRDQHSIVPISLGGRVDVYVRTQELPQSVDRTVTAVLVDVVADGGIWQFSVDSDVAPGFYDVERITQLDADLDANSYEVVEDMRGSNLTGDRFIPDIVSPVESAYSRFQTAVIRFLDTDTVVTDADLGTTREYTASLRTMPLVGDIQDFVAGRLQRCRPADVLVKAAIPCFVTVSFDIRKPAADASPDVEAIKTAVAAAVNNLGFTDVLHASTIIDVVHASLVGRQAVGTIELLGTVRAPSGENLHIRGTTSLEVPYDPARMVTGETTVFILDPQDIGVQVVSSPTNYV